MKTKKVVILGLGYVGAALAVRASMVKHFKVVGFDPDQRKVDLVNSGRSPVKSITDDHFKYALKAGLVAKSKCPKADIFVVCVPTPLTKQGHPDLQFVISAGHIIGGVLRKGNLVILESTSHPGTTEGEFAAAIGLHSKMDPLDYYLAFSPERENPVYGAGFKRSPVPKLVGGYNLPAKKRAVEFYEEVCRSAGDPVVPVSSTQVAEAAKLLENSFRLINIAFINEFKSAMLRLGIDPREVIAAAATKPFGFMRFNPSAGAGGHCIPVDPVFMVKKAQSVGEPMNLLDLAIQQNTMEPAKVVRETLAAILKHKTAASSGPRSVLVVGIAYKRNSDDVRESPAHEVIDHLGHFGVNTMWHDPLIEDDYGHDVSRVHSLDIKSVRRFSAVLIISDHDAVDWTIVGQARLIVDTTGRMSGAPERKGTVIVPA